MAGLRSLWLAAERAVASPGLWPIALAGFLVRGGIVLFVLPVVVLPSVVGLGTLVGPASLTPNGPTTGLLIRIALVVGFAVAALIGGTIVGAAAEVAMVQAVQPGPDRSADGPVEADQRSLVGQVAVVRLVSLVPVAIALAIGLPRLGQITYLELTSPTDLVTPIALRVAAQVPEVVAMIVLAWLASETWAGLAIRLVVLRGTSVISGLLGAFGLLVRRPVQILAVVLVSLVVAVAILGLVLVVLAWSWGLARATLLGSGGSAGISLMIATTLLFVACWTIGLGLAGGLATWRSVALTLTVGEDHRGSVRIAPERATL
jgi:hypothetical protein